MTEKKILQKYIYNDLIKIVFDYANEYILLDWIERKINNTMASLKTRIKNKKKQNKNSLIINMVWQCLSINPNAVDLLKENSDKIDWMNLSKNPGAITIITDKLLEQTLKLGKRKNCISWNKLSLNSNAVHSFYFCSIYLIKI
jgi:hypothetical protein